MQKFYIADTHFGHQNILRFDNRPWFDTSSMEDDMIALWNEKVTKADEVYILGDFCWGTAEDWKRILPKLRGKKHLIRGNHDLRQIPQNIRSFFVSISDYKETRDGDLSICMSHYPMLSYRHDRNPDIHMFYGHVHNTAEYKAIKEAAKTFKDTCIASGFDSYQGNLHNCWCGFYGWAPATAEEIINSGH